MTVHLTSKRDAPEHGAIAAKAEERMKERFGVKIAAEVSAPGSLDEWTEIHTSPKPKRFRDERS
jgi:hypothetical protein